MSREEIGAAIHAAIEVGLLVAGLVLLSAAAAILVYFVAQPMGMFR